MRDAKSENRVSTEAMRSPWTAVTATVGGGPVRRARFLARSATLAPLICMALMVSALSDPARGQTSTGMTAVSNLTKQLAPLDHLVGYYDPTDPLPQVRAQGFRTGGKSTDKFTLARVIVDVGLVSNYPALTVKIYTASPPDHADPDGNPYPLDAKHTLTNPASFTQYGRNSFWAPKGATLTGQTDYFIVFENRSRHASINLRSTASDDQKGLAGWSILDVHHTRRLLDTSWDENGNALRFSVRIKRTEPSVSVSDARGQEGDDLEFAVRLSGASAKEIKVDYATSVAPGDTASAADFTATSGTLTFPAGDTEKTITVRAASDSQDEPDETFTMTLSEPVNVILNDHTATGTITGTIVDDSEPVLSLEFPEGGEIGHSGWDDSAEFRLRIDGPGDLDTLVAALHNVHVDLRFELLHSSWSSSGRACAYFHPENIAGRHSDGSFYTLTCSWSIDRHYPVGVGPGLIKLYDAPGYRVGSPSMLCVEFHESPPCPPNWREIADRPFLWVGNSTASEGDTYISFPLRLSRPVPADLRVMYATVGLKANGDYVDVDRPFDGEDAGGSVTRADFVFPHVRGEAWIPEGEVTASIDLPIVDDSLVETTETMLLLMGVNNVDPEQAQHGYSIDTRVRVASDQAVGTIFDNDRVAAPLSAELAEVPASHDGNDSFTFRVRFSDWAEIDAEAMRVHVFTVSGGTVTEARPADTPHGEGQGRRRSYRQWEITVEPHGKADVEIRLPATTDCAAPGAVCTRDGRMLSQGASVGVAGPAETAPLSAELTEVPARHRGPNTSFTFEVRFSESFPISFRTMRDRVFTVTGGRVTAAGRLDYYVHREGQGPQANQDWEITVEPYGTEDVEIRLPATTDCAALRAVCTSDGRMLSQGVSAVVEGPVWTPDPEPALTARFENVPAIHRGLRPFTFRVRFSEPFPIGFRTMRDRVFRVSGGRVTGAGRVDHYRHEEGRGTQPNQEWEITVAPEWYWDITIRLPATTDCTQSGAVCTVDGRKLSNTVSATVAGVPGVSVSDARVREAEGAVLVFNVTVERALPEEMTVYWQTENHTARAGSDYKPSKGKFIFAPGQTERTIPVEVLNDAHDEGPETMFLHIFKTTAEDAWLKDHTATGTIENDDPMPRAWLARFGRTAASQAMDTIGARMEGGGGSHVRVGGQVLPLTGDGEPGGKEPEAGLSALEVLMRGRKAPLGTTRSMTGREFLLGSSFHLSAGGEAGAAGFAAWGRFAADGFDAEVDGVRMDGNVTTGFLGADMGRERWLAGLALSLSEGEGSFALTGGEDDDRGEVESTLTAVYPYVRLGLNERVDAWGVAGYGTGELTLTLKADAHRAADERYETDIAMRMGGVGVRGELLTPADSGGFAVAVKSDAFWVRTESKAVAARVGSHGNLAASEADASRVRLVVEGSRSFEAGAGTITPTLELALRHDGGDAETGTGVELGAGLRYAGDRVTVEGVVRTLIAHEESGYEEWGASGAVRIDPGASGRGLSLTVTPAWGAARSGTERLWRLADARGLAPAGTFDARRRLDAELGYGLALGGAPVVVTPYTGLSFVEEGERAWRAGARWHIARGAAFVLEGIRSESDGSESESSLALRASFRW